MNRTPVADWQKLSALYELADTLTADALDDWLAQLRQQAHPLLSQLEQMLAARSQNRHNGFLGDLPRLPAPPEPRGVAWQAGSRIGPYRLVRKIGSGGMAEVWLAQRDDGAFQRQVAIKLLFRHAGSSERDTFAQRFDRERDILASLDHPHIARLHDAGVTPGGQPWLALEYVEGQTLTTWCDERRLSIEARVRLFRQVLLAVQHAHVNLVIHRDLKPGNILVTSQGEVRLLDFGIAKLMEAEGGALIETELTRIAGRPMTPQYASPEQLRGQPLTTACDVYSLGVVLYELLCGERPYELKVESTAQLEQAILDTEPRAPSRRALAEPLAVARGTNGPMLRKQLASDLDAIVLRALAKQPAGRYGSVEAFGADLDRWLVGEPVEARAPSTVYRAGKFVRRHVLSVSLGVGAVVALMVVAAVAVVMGLQAREDSARAVAARDFMLNIFARANQEKSRGADITARDLLETGRKDVLTRLAGQPRLQTELLKGIATIQSDMGEYVTADGPYAELVAIYRGLGQPRDEALAIVDRALNAISMSNVEFASSLLRSAQAVPGRPLGDAQLNAGLAEVEGRIELGRSDPRRARDMLRAARQAAIKALGEKHLSTFKLGQVLVRAEHYSGDLDEASKLQDHLRETAKNIDTLGPDEIAAMDLEQINLLSRRGRYGRAMELVEAALPQCIQLLGALSQPCRYLTVSRGQMLLKLSRADEAFQMLPGLVAIGDDATLPYLQIEALLIELRARSTRGEDSTSPALVRVVERVRQFGESGKELPVRITLKASALLGLAEALVRAGETSHAQRRVTQALALLDTATNESTFGIARYGRMLMGITLLLDGKPSDALDWFQRAETAHSTTSAASQQNMELIALNRAAALVKLGRFQEAMAIVERTQPVLKAALGEGAPSYQRVAAFLRQLEEQVSAMQRFNSNGLVKPQLTQDFRGFEPDFFM